MGSSIELLEISRLEALRIRFEQKKQVKIPLLASEIDQYILASEDKIDDQMHLKTSIDSHRIYGSKYATMIR